MEWDYGLDPVTCSQKEWDEQMGMLQAAPYDLDRYPFSPHLYMPRSEAKKIFQVMSLERGEAYAQKYMKRYWKKVIPDWKFYNRFRLAATFERNCQGGPCRKEIDRMLNRVIDEDD
jgi:hypothetical protein